jgi:hypothetical protein
MKEVSKILISLSADLGDLLTLKCPPVEVRGEGPLGWYIPSWATCSARSSFDSSSSEAGGEGSLSVLNAKLTGATPRLLPVPLTILSLPSIPFPVPSALNLSYWLFSTNLYCRFMRGCTL